MKKYCVYHLHSDLSLLDSTTNFKDYVDLAVSQGMTAIASTEHGLPRSWVEKKMYCDEWFGWNTPQMSLTAEAIVGKYRIRFMATLIGDESPTPLRRSDGFDIWTKEIPRVGHKFPMAARDYRKLLEIYENPRLKEADKVKAIEKTLKHDVQDAYLGCKDVMDFMNLEVDLGVLKKPISEDKIFWEDN